MTKMIPPVPTSAVMMPTPKQKIGFSIASIVGTDGGSNPAGSNNIANSNVSGNNTITITNIDNNRQNDNEFIQNNSSNNSNGLSSPPQTPPMLAVGATHLRPAHFYSVTQTHLPTHPQLTTAQQHALHQHLLLHHQHQYQQQQHQEQQQSHLPPQQQQHQSSLKTTPKSPNSSPCRTSVPPQDIQDIIQRLHNSASAAVAAANLSATAAASSEIVYSSTPQNIVRRLHQHTRLLGSPEPLAESTSSPSALHLKRERSPLPPKIEQAQNPAQRHQPPQTPPISVSPPCVTSHLPSSPSSTLHPNSPPLTPHQYQKPGPILLGPGGISPAGLVRPFPMGPRISGGPGGPAPPPPPPQQHMPDIKALPPYINAPPELPPQHNPHLIAAAQFQMAAALQAGHVLGPAAAAAAAAGIPPHASFMPNPGMPRDSYPLYPWLLSRHGRIFPHRFPGNFLLQPFRKPKRIRTAFSPSQLLKLEHAFESNQYVVGAERKALAQSLNLSETQVKVWFQNRRTKHKRMQQEDEKGGCSGSGGGVNSERNSQGGVSCDDDDDDELIDMEMDDCPSDEEHETEHVGH